MRFTLPVHFFTRYRIMTLRSEAQIFDQACSTNPESSVEVSFEATLPIRESKLGIEEKSEPVFT